MRLRQSQALLRLLLYSLALLRPDRYLHYTPPRYDMGSLHENIDQPQAPSSEPGKTDLEGQPIPRLALEPCDSPAGQRSPQSIDAVGAVRASSLLWEHSVVLPLATTQLQMVSPTGEIRTELSAEVRKSETELVSILRAVRTPPSVNVVTTSTSGQVATSLLPLADQHRSLIGQVHPENSPSKLHFNVRLRGELGLSAITHSVDVFNRTHAAPCALIQGAAQQIKNDQGPALELVDLTDLCDRDQDQAVIDRVASDMRSELPRGDTHAVHCVLFRKSDTDHLLRITASPTVVGTWSPERLCRELHSLYITEQTGKEPQHDATARFVADAVSHDALTAHPSQSAQIEYWKAELRDLPSVLDLPTDRLRPTRPTQRLVQASSTLDSALIERLRTVAQESGTTLSVLVMATLELLLWRYSGQSDFAVGVPVKRRENADLKHATNALTNTLIVRADVATASTFRSLLGLVRDRVSRAFANRDVPFEQLVQAISPDQLQNHTPFCQASFDYEDLGEGDERIVDFELESLPSVTSSSQTDISAIFRETGTRAIAVIAMAEDLFVQASADRWMRSWQTILEAVAAQDDQQLAKIPVVAAVDRNSLVARLALEIAPETNDLVHRMFERVAAAHPDKTAVFFEDSAISFRELDESANQLAHVLIAGGVGPDKLVGVCLPRSIEMIVAMLAVMKAGGGYVPLDPSYPRERLEVFVADARAALVISNVALSSRLALGPVQLLLDRDGAAITKQPLTACVADHSPEQLAYVIYTSGSTGRPKAVMVEHRNVMNLFAALREQIGLGDDGVWLAGGSMSFDISIPETWGCLCHGQSIVLVGDMVLGEAKAARFSIAAQCARYSVTHVQCTPSQARILMLSAPTRAILSGLKQLIVAGEALPQELADALTALVQGAVFNGYGPTEVTVYSAIARIRPGDRVTIGRTIPHVTGFIVDTRGELAPVGAVGELLLGGGSVTRGYLDRPEITAERFIANTFDARAGTRLYRSGDLVRLDAEGQMQYLGRNDNQVKIRGYRLELGEIEGTIAKVHGVKAVVVIAVGEGEAKRLAAFLTTEPGFVHDGALREEVKRSLPDYMVPASFTILPSLPLTPSGKIDRLALPDPVTAVASNAHVEPATDIEATLAAIWMKHFNTPHVNTNSNFFELGGHSLLAVLIFNDIEQAFDIRLPLTILFEGPTIAQLGAHIQFLRSGYKKLALYDWSTVVPMQHRGSLPPFFCAAGIGGSPMNLIHLASALGSDQPFYGLQYRGIDGFLEPHRTIREMAIEFLSDIRCIQPEGPYYLGGFSMGGVVAYEMAMVLQEQGEAVGLVVMLDAQAPTLLMWTWWERIVEHANRLQQEGPRYLLTRTRDRWHREIESLRLRLSVAFSLKDRYASRHERVRRAGHEALRNYVPGSFAGDVLLIRAHLDLEPTDGIGYRTHESNGWREYITGRFQIEQLEMRHLDLATKGAAPRAAPPITQALVAARQLALNNHRRSQAMLTPDGSLDAIGSR
jgi:amino acid adenylation domain-containing protein